ncbi:MAG: P-loop ATPase, Sll1717 family [Candidatus Acidiferrales bacterium]
MTYRNDNLSTLLQGLDLGSSVAEADTLLETARVETSAFTDLLNDRVDLIPGTKGSGKSALFRIFVDFLPDILLRQQKVVVAHGIQAPGDPVFHAFTERFSQLSEDEFVSFWCIYLVSLAHEQFIKGPRYRGLLDNAKAEIDSFERACVNAKIPDIQAKKSLKDILEWSLHTLASWRPRFTYRPQNASGEWEVDLFGTKTASHEEKTEENSERSLPNYVNEINQSLETVLRVSKLSLWLMVDRLDEIFPRRSDVERTALRGLLRAMRYFASPSIRVKVFLRDDMLEQVVRTDAGFTALTHLTARKADTLRWTQDQILAMVVKRFFANDDLVTHLEINVDQLNASPSYRKQCFDKIFPSTVFKGPKQSPTIRWICNRCADGRGVVTPRDVLDLLIHAKQKQQDIYAADQEGTSDSIIGAAAIQYGFEELSKRKRQTYLQAEFPHLWKDCIEKFSGGKTDYSATTLQGLLGTGWKATAEQLLDIGFLSKRNRKGEAVYSIPVLYRHGMNVTQGMA